MNRKLAAILAVNLGALGILAYAVTAASQGAQGATHTTTTIPRDPWPRQFYLLLGTGEPRLRFTPPYTAYDMQSRYYAPTNSWYLTGTPQLYVYPAPSGREPLKLGEAGAPTP